MYQQDYTPLAHSLALSAIAAAVPLAGLFILLGILRIRAWLASLIGLAAALGVAILIYGMPPGMALASASQGAAFGAFPAMWIVINAIWVYQLTVRTGHFDVLRRSFGNVSPDQRVQAIIIAFCFGALMEALAGFGTPVAITAVMLIGLGFKPIKAATVALVANTAPVAFGAVALPIVTLSAVTGLPERSLAEVVGRQTPVLALFVPLVLVFIVDGRRGIRETWPAALVGGVVFGLAQFTMANYGAIALADIVAALAAAGAVVLLLRVWQPVIVRAGNAQDGDQVLKRGGTDVAPSAGGVGPGPVREPVPTAAGGGTTGVMVKEQTSVKDSRREVLLAYFPYLVIVVVFSLANVPAIKDLLGQATQVFKWPGVHVVSPSGKALTLSTYKFDWLANIGTLLLVIGVVTALTLKVSFRDAIREYWQTLVRLRTAIVTVLAVLALAYVMNASGQTVTLGLLMAQVGAVFALVSPVVGWLGTAVTGSDTSSNSLFGTLQVSAAHAAGLKPLLTAAGNTSGGVLGKMISPQNLAVGAAAVGLAGREGELFRKVFGWTLVFLAFMSVLVFLQSTVVLSWMLP